MLAGGCPDHPFSHYLLQILRENINALQCWTGGRQSLQHAQGPLSSSPAWDQPASREHLQESATAEFNLIYTDKHH